MGANKRKKRRQQRALLEASSNAASVVAERSAPVSAPQSAATAAPATATAAAALESAATAAGLSPAIVTALLAAVREMVEETAANAKKALAEELGKEILVAVAEAVKQPQTPADAAEAASRKTVETEQRRLEELAALRKQVADGETRERELRKKVLDSPLSSKEDIEAARLATEAADMQKQRVAAAKARLEELVGRPRDFNTVAQTAVGAVVVGALGATLAAAAALSTPFVVLTALAGMAVGGVLGWLFHKLT